MCNVKHAYAVVSQPAPILYFILANIAFAAHLHLEDIHVQYFFFPLEGLAVKDGNAYNRIQGTQFSGENWMLL